MFVYSGTILVASRDASFGAARGLRQLVAIVALLVAVAPALAAAVGMVTDLTGKAWTGDGAARQPLAILAYLEPATLIEVEKGGSVSITFYSPSEEQVFSGPAKFRIEKQGITRISGAAPAVQRMGALAANATAKEMSLGGRRTQAAVRMRSLAVGVSIIGLSPDKTALRSTVPRFSWGALPDVAKYRLTLTTGEGVPVLEESVAGTEWRVPIEKALAPGRDYIWSVEAMPADGAKVIGKARFSILDADTTTRLAAESPKAGASFAQRLRYAITLEAAGLADDARVLWRELAKERPDELAVQKRAQL
ncbi:MAG: fibronectin type III domain-containing protein [Sulfuritalea sp.]|jgi:hypothetical protein|nr:fibronectin type III domain-containing protein [Sulfuritalea sp.]